MSDNTHLEEIFEADRNLRAAEERLLREKDKRTLIRDLQNAVKVAKTLKDPDETTMRLVRLADLCAQVEGPEMVDALIHILDDESPAARVAAGEALLDVGYERYAELARAVERLLEKPAMPTAMAELPWVIAEIGEPSAAALTRRFLAHEDAHVVASAIEVAVELGDLAALPLLEKLVDDSRRVQMEDENEEYTSSVGELATEAVEELSILAESDEDDEDDIERN